MKHWQLAGLVVLLLIVVSYAFWPTGQTPDPELDIKTRSQAPLTQAINKTVKARSPITTAEFSADDQIDPYQDAAMRAQMLQVADLYEAASKYPHFSQPITNPDMVREPLPFEETEVDLPFPVEGSDAPIRLSAAVDRYQYFQGDVMTVRLLVTGAPADTFVQANAELSSAVGATPLVTELTATDASLSNFVGNFDTRVAPPGSLSTEMLVKIVVSIGEQQLFTTVPLRYTQAAAQLVAVPYVRQEAEYLLIPLQYSVNQPGYYFANAVLADAASGQPLLQLQTEGQLPLGNGVLMLKAHFQALRAMGSEGPYILRNINTYRGAASGETFDVPAGSVQPQFEIQGFPFSQYDDVPYQDELAGERLEFLRNLGGVDDSSDEEPNEAR
ncbi:hypothetical protein [Arenicella xantha]|uniref:Uncharacterized protein n=1 Tax=Arenicella xantha TaxID=644221 RepID=A0A395JTF0_9GAMM|nr:hypothetical protein [Arenicella xantha]RBP53766.1 hypothetical protein DFR28_1011155 [Arenicella xantha]